MESAGFLQSLPAKPLIFLNTKSQVWKVLENHLRSNTAKLVVSQQSMNMFNGTIMLKLLLPLS